MSHDHGSSSLSDTLLRVISIIGLVAIIVVGAWGIIQIVVGLPELFSRFGADSSVTTKKPTEEIVLTSPATVTAGQPFTLTWQHTNSSGNYSYTLSYACAEGLSFAAPTPAGSYQQVPCNTPFNYTNATAHVDLIAVFTTSAPKQTETTFSIKATRLSDTTTTATATSNTVSVTPAKSTQTATQNTSTRSTTSANTSSRYTSSGRTTNLYGSPDLAVRIISAQPAHGRYSVEFEVSNVGTNVAPYGWEFTANLPLNPPYTFLSQSQQKLYPGDKIVYTLGFDAPSYGYYNTFSVTADPQYLVSDPNRANNSASVSVGY